MKKFSMIALGIVAIGLPLAAFSQDLECFIEDTKGRKVDLGNICGRDRPTPFPAPTGEQVVHIPIKSRRGNTPIIDVTFNGNQIFEMIVDTGATGTVITRQMATSLQVRPFTYVKAQIADGSTVRFPIGFVRSLGVPGALVENVPVAIGSDIRVGLLGNDFLGQFDVKIKRYSIELYQR